MKRLLRSPKWKLSYKDYSKIINRFTGRASSPHKKSILTTKAAVLIPLSPLQIYKVHIYPTSFAFGMVNCPKYNIVTHKIDQVFQKSQKIVKKLYYFRKKFCSSERDASHKHLFLMSTFSLSLSFLFASFLLK